MKKQTFLDLLEKYQSGTASTAERELVDRLYEVMSSQDQSHLSGEEQLLLAQVRERLIRAADKEVAPVKRINWIRYAAAAVIILVAGAGGWYLFQDQPAVPPVVATAKVKAPDRNRATVTLGDARVVYLDQVKNGELATLGNIHLVKTADGKLVYQGVEGNTIQPVVNTVSNPRGSRVIDLTLTDGSHVWLNAGSSITYPVPMSGKERDVTVKGEAYFEVAKDVNRPFRVTKGDITVTVLGTHFNINAYEDEPDTKVTLLEGSVRVAKASAVQVIRPGEQAVLSAGGNIDVRPDVDTEQVMAWKEGKFRFQNTDIEVVMRQIERWYDVKVVYQGAIPKRGLGGGMPRTENANSLLEGLSETGIVHFKTEGKTITVIPGKSD